MPEVTYVAADGTERKVQVPEGRSVMQGAIQNGVRGIDADCGGVLSCATCHVYVDPDWVDRLEPPSEDEEDMLSNTAAERRDGSRLSCQIEMTEDLDGLRVQIPETQS
ncbi:2Fe-2S iron-sulfur cluster-binding protein [Roseomonas populi]|uniref:2Fe-2S iron-sulfur cluster-binding protein n=1 Tax=Roseomonas populi TaxID=3121582 RepID=A0ABT1WZ93_9PROT|nr:2Fe-2S iron-sulfur cluster-binding protein [Roseomonas pecuniae]MCR0981175.1 2Fe-2S iron-sulfur cluster-binding protein [Roseomonas pecuniae]